MKRVLVIDNYDSFVYNIVQYLGELGAYPLVYRNDSLTLEDVERLEPDAIVISPGPGDPSDPRYFGVCREVILTMGPTTPILGVCLGHQGIVHAFGGEVVRASRLMHGKTSTVSHDGEGVFSGVKNPLRAARYHSLAAKRATLPRVLEVSAVSMEDGEIMGVRHVSYPVEGVQFHPESVLTEDGHRILGNFLAMRKR